MVTFIPSTYRITKHFHDVYKGLSAGTILPVDWLDHSLKNMAVTEAAIKDSQTLRDKMCVTIQVMKDSEDSINATNSMTSLS